MQIDHDLIQKILGKLSDDERDVIAGQLKARALTKPKTKIQNYQVVKVETSDGATVTFAIGPKGNVRVYGLDRKRPVALFGKQWRRLLDVAGELQNYIDKNGERLKEIP